MIRAIVLFSIWFAASLSGASAADKLKVAIGQREIWHGQRHDFTRAPNSARLSVDGEGQALGPTHR